MRKREEQGRDFAQNKEQTPAYEREKITLEVLHDIRELLQQLVALSESVQEEVEGE